MLRTLSERFQRFIISEGEKHGWKLDNTQDLARILRIPGTLNFKSNPPKRVTVVEYNQDARYDIEDFKDLPELVKEPTKDSQSESGNASKKFEPWNGPPALIKPIYDNCGWVRHCYDNARSLGYNDWFAIFSILKNCEKGEQLVIEWSEPHPEFEEQATLKQSEYAEGYRPRTCKSVRYDLGHEDLCSKCQYWGLIKSPITIGDPRPLERSLTITNNCAVLIQADSSIVFKEPCLKALLIIQKVNPSAYERIRSVLSKAVGITRLETQMKKYLKSHPDDFQEDMKRYEVSNNRIIYNKPTNDGYSAVTLCNFNSRITQEFVRDDGISKSISFRIDTTLDTGEKLPVVEISSESFSNINWFRDKYGSRAIVYPGVDRGHLPAAIQTLSGTPPRRHIYPFTGWIKIKGVWAYCTNSGALGPEGILEDVDVDLSEGELKCFSLSMPSKDDNIKDLAQQSIKMLNLGPLKVVVPVFCGLFLSPLSSEIDLDFSLFIYGTTGSQKSETAAIAQAHYGHKFNGRNLPGSWTSTANALEKAVYLAKDSFFVIDDFKFSGNNFEDVQLNKLAERVLRGAGNRAGRSRMSKDLLLRQAYFPRGLILSTGEELPKGESLRGRILFLSLSPGDTNLTVLTELQASAANSSLSKFMSIYISWLCKKINSIKPLYQNQLTVLRANLVNKIKAHSRTPDIVAKLIFGAQCFHWFITDNQIFDKKTADDFYYSSYATLIEVGNDQNEIINEEDPSKKFITLIVSSLNSGICHIEDVTGGVPKDPTRWGYIQTMESLGPAQTPIYQAQGKRIGWTNGKDVYLDPVISFSVAQELAFKTGSGIPVSSKMLRKRLKEKGFLLSFEGTSTNARVTIQGKRIRVTHLHEASLR